MNVSISGNGAANGELICATTAIHAGRAARDAGVMFAVDSDAHSTAHLGYLQYGIGQAQRGRLTGEHVINSWPLPRLQEFLRKGR